MTVAPAKTASSERVAPSAPSQSSRVDRIGFFVCMVAVVVPIVGAAVRLGSQGWFPTLDAAATVGRTRAVFSAHPPLVGMSSAAGGWANAELHFPGALQMYLLAVPVRLLGNTWGTLLGMAGLNVAWVLAAGWLLRRRLGLRGATIGLAFVALLLWTMGSHMLVDITPMQMVTIPFALFLIAVWSVADGDITALPVLAFVANFLILDHLVLTFLVPVVGVCAPLGLAYSLRHEHRFNPDGHTLRMKRLRRGLTTSIIITAVLWIPPMYQQITSPQGNLSALLHASSAPRPSTISHGAAYQTVISLLTRPPFWFRPTISGSHVGPHNGLAIDIAIGIGLLAVAIGLGYMAVRRRDLTSVMLLGIATVCVAAMVENITQAPTEFGFPIGYLRSMWPMAMLFWLSIGVATYRACSSHAQSLMSKGGAVAVVVISVLAFMPASFEVTNEPDPAPVAKALNRQVIPKLQGSGPIYVTTSLSLVSHSFYDSLLLAMSTAGIPYCVTPEAAHQYGKVHDCRDRAVAHLHVSNGVTSSTQDGTLLFKWSFLTHSERRRLAELDRLVDAWLGSIDHLTIRPQVRNDLLKGFSPQMVSALEAKFTETGGNLDHLREDGAFRSLILSRASTRGDADAKRVFTHQPIDPNALIEWAKLQDQHFHYGFLIVTELPYAP